VTNISQLYRLSQDKQRTICSVRLEGVVCDVTPNRDNMALRDGSGDLDVNMDLRGRSIQPGQKVLVEGTGIMNERGLSLQPVPLVDNDNVHGMSEVAGTISLKAGRHPIRLTWFQCDGPFGWKPIMRDRICRIREFPPPRCFENKLIQGREIPTLFQD